MPNFFTVFWTLLDPVFGASTEPHVLHEKVWWKPGEASKDSRQGPGGTQNHAETISTHSS